MYILKNSLISIIRNKGRNILIGIIILVIACASTVTLAIRNTADNLVKDYEKSHDIIGTISFNRQKLSNNFKGGENSKKSNIQAFNNIESLTLENVEKYGESDYLKSYYYVYSTSLNSDTLSKATDKFEYEVEDRRTTKSSTSETTVKEAEGENNRPGGGNFPNFPMGERNTVVNNYITTVITKTKETFGSTKALNYDFEIQGYSSYEAMEKFIDGTYKIEDGEIISNFDEFECVISEELASLNEVKVGDTITFKNPDNDKTYDFIVKGIFKDNGDNNNSFSMYSSSANTIITGSGVIKKLVEEDEKIVTNITPSFILKDEANIDNYAKELNKKGLNDYYELNTNIDEIKNATKSIENVKIFATTFLIITFIISAVVLLVINMINIRERKYEIGVFRTIGMSKTKLTIQFLLELLIVAIIMLSIGAVIGGFLAKPIGNMLLQNEITANESKEEQISNNFGRDMKGPMNIKYNGKLEVEEIDEIDAVVDIVVVAQLLGIGIILVFISSIASMISIQRFSPLTILKERS